MTTPSPKPPAPPTARPRSAAYFDQAQRCLVGGVNSPVRAFTAVGGTPVFVQQARGPYIYDVDGNEYFDLVGAWGTAIVGHAHDAVVAAVTAAAARGLSFGAPCQAETELAALIISALPSTEKIRFVNSGTEAVMSAIRLARAATGRSKIVKFKGCYHGHADYLLVEAGSGAATLSMPASAGVPPETAHTTLLADYNDSAGVRKLMDNHGHDVAAIIVEPIAGNMGYVEPAEGFLATLAAQTHAHDCLLIFDEIMTGFRVAWGGYQRISGVTPDITCLGKVIGGGMPCAAYAARAELMDHVAPLGTMYQAGTLSGNPIAMAAGLATLNICRHPGFYELLQERAARLADGIAAAATAAGLAVQCGAAGGMLGVTFAAEPMRNYADAKAADHALYAKFFHAMLNRGVWLPPSGYEAWFLSSAHEDEHIDRIIHAGKAACREISR